MWFNDYKRRMTASIDILSKEFGGIRSGRATGSLLDPIKVSAYGGVVPLSQVAGISAPESRMLIVQVWDQALTKAVEKAIRDSDLGLNPSGEGSVIRVPIPAMTEQRRMEISKMAGKYAEDAKVSIRNVRRDAIDILKKEEKSKEISEDELHRKSDEIQKLTDEMIKKIDEMLSQKQKEVMQV